MVQISRFPGFDDQVRGRFTSLVASGSSVRAAAKAVGVNYSVALRFATEHGLPVRARRLDANVDALIHSLLAAGLSVKEVAACAGCSYSAVYARKIKDATYLKQPVTAKTSTATRCDYLRLRLAGITNKDAARIIGINIGTGRDYEKGLAKSKGTRRRYIPKGSRAAEYNKLMTRFEQLHIHRSTTQIEPAIPAGKADDHLRVINKRYLSYEQREQIRDLHLAGCTNTEIAKELGVHRSTIGRELARNRDQQGRYLPSHASKLAWSRRRRPKVAKIAANHTLHRLISEKLHLDWSPEQVSAWLKQNYPDEHRLQVCHETIYQALYQPSRGGLQRELPNQLRTGRRRRKPHRTSQQRTPRFRAGMVNISERPKEADDRTVPGHWEGDLIIGAHGQSAIATLVERASRFVMLVHLPDAHDAVSVGQGLVEAIGSLPDALKRSLTWDQGSEMALHDQFTTATGCPVFFCDPGSPWQRGSNENTNGLLRQYFPKGTDLSVHSAKRLQEVADLLNNRPRKKLNWNTPAEQLAKLLSSTQQSCNDS